MIEDFYKLESCMTKRRTNEYTIKKSDGGIPHGIISRLDDVG